MGRVTRAKLMGSSMIEAIVSSLIFLTVFIVSLQTVSGFVLRQDEGYMLIEAERRLRDCFGRYGDGTWAEGTYTDEFAWGRITTVVSAYRDYSTIQQVFLRAELHGSRKTVEHRQLIPRRDE